MTLAAVVLALLVQEQVDNPEYKGWASFKPGSTVTHKGGAQNIEQKTTLKSLGDGELVLELEISMGGKAMGRPAERKITAKLPAEQAPKVLKEGEEEVEAGGKTLKCAWKEFEKKLPGGKVATMKVFSHGDIPGMAARIDVSLDGGARNTMVATAWEKK